MISLRMLAGGSYLDILHVYHVHPATLYIAFYQVINAAISFENRILSNLINARRFDHFVATDWLCRGRTILFAAF